MTSSTNCLFLVRALSIFFLSMSVISQRSVLSLLSCFDLLVFATWCDTRPTVPSNLLVLHFLEINLLIYVLFFFYSNWTTITQSILVVEMKKKTLLIVYFQAILFLSLGKKLSLLVSWHISIVQIEVNYQVFFCYQSARY